MEKRILKGCNLCLSHERRVRLMGPRARVAWCHRCKARSIWDPLSPEEIEKFEAARARRAAFIEELMNG